MKKKKILIVSAVILLFLTIITAVSTIAADGDTTTQPKIEKSGGVELESKRFPISRYQANNEASDKFLEGPICGDDKCDILFCRKYRSRGRCGYGCHV